MQPYTFFSLAYGECTYGTTSFNSDATTCTQAGAGGGSLAPTGLPISLIIGLTVGLALLGAAILLHRSRKKNTTLPPFTPPNGGTLLGQ
jgi:LPXTG-motif cell wall-anchored protein